MPSKVSNEPKYGLKRFFVGFEQEMASFPLEKSVHDDFVLHHLRTVLRGKPGEWFVLVDGSRHIAYEAELVSLDKKCAQFRLLNEREREIKPLPPLTLAVALLKEQRWDMVLQKATELGVSVVQPIMAERSVVKILESDWPKKQARWGDVLLSAAIQSEGLRLPVLNAPVTVQEFANSQVGSGGLKVLLQERGENRATLKQVLRQLGEHQPGILAIGPEGGWSDAEITQWQAAGFIGASLGERILRSETAVIAALSAWLYEFQG